MEPIQDNEPTGPATRRVSYYFDPDVGTYAYTMVHPMKVRNSSLPNAYSTVTGN